MAGLRPEEEKPRSVLPVPAGEDAEMPRRKIRHPARACTAEEKREFPEMNLTDHAGVRLIHGKPKVNGVEIHDSSGGGGEPVFLLHGVPNAPELLLTGRERQFWTYYARRQMWDPARWPRRISTKSCTRPSSRAATGPSWRCTVPARPTPNRTGRITPTRSAARSWPSARRPISGTK